MERKFSDNTIRRVNKQIFGDVNDKVRALESIFPSAVKDGQVDFNALKEELGEFYEVGPEKYELTWSGKQNAKKIAQQDIVGKTLKYIPEESKNPETTENIYIEGDNLEVLKLLRENYYGAIKMIYIDPPYNTGNDFVYKDNFNMSKEDSDKREGETSELGDRYTVNSKSSNRYHANWLNMMYPRLKTAKELLKEDGVIFISIDDNEVNNLKNMCNEIYGEDNFITELVVIRAEGGGLAKQVIKGHDYILVYCKNINVFKPLGRPKDIRGKVIEKDGQKYWIQEDWLRKEFGKYGNCYYEEIVKYKGIEKKKEIDLGLSEGKYMLIKKDNGLHIVGKLRNVNEDASKFYTVIKHLSAEGISDLDKIEMKQFFSYPKPTSLIKELVLGATFFSRNESDIILDFFSGSSTTAAAIMEVNLEYKGNSKFIMVQIPENIDSNKYKNICEVGKERIRRAGERIKKENKDKEGINDLDIGFKVFRVGDTNIRWNYKSENIKSLNDRITKMDEQVQTTFNVIANDYEDESDKDKLDFMPGTKDIDIVYEILLRQRDIHLSTKIELLDYIGKRTYIFEDSFVVCLEENITKEMIEKLAAINPLPIKYVFRDSAFGDDIALKDETYRRLNLLIESKTGDRKKAYTIEFI